MAYNRPYNPDELPRFAEPEHKGGAPPRPSPTTASHPRPSPATAFHPHPQRHDSSASSHYPSRYDSKPQPAPPRPSDDPRREDPRREDPRRVDSHRQTSGSSAAPSHGFGATSPPPTNQPRLHQLKRMTDVFKKYDDDRDGYITLSFEDFLSEILKQLK
ncbi:predicted protein [Verticillium alfalfae VaMs.102]|uniref:Predicted protein n=1 Tax=Verticillium alfalfae (strain VaMs.102 / ATCC MYA-4576 / FGSC 10136) TaxID=526221 RepID=C9SMG4_VERA1|nr:predicted protein [Verticillium alfalfae VaMs.102]EEY19979.1 predicted protein [Verticillium alfalfae VaMs.102]